MSTASSSSRTPRRAPGRLRRPGEPVVFVTTTVKRPADQFLRWPHPTVPPTGGAPDAITPDRGEARVADTGVQPRDLLEPQPG